MPYTSYMKNTSRILSAVLLSAIVFLNASPVFASIYPVGAAQFSLAGAGINSTQTTVPLSSFTTPDGRAITMSMLGTIGYGALEPQSTAKLEDITFTGVTQNANGTATLTGVTRGRDFVTPYAGSTSLAHSHAGGATFILTNTAGFYTQFGTLANDETVTGQWTFSTFPITPASPAGSETTAGILQLATGLQAASSTASGTLGRLALSALTATDTPTVGCSAGYTTIPGAGCTPIVNLKGKIDKSLYDLSSPTLTGTTTFTGATQGLDWQVVAQASTSSPTFNLLQATTSTGVAYKRYRVEIYGGGFSSGNDVYKLNFNNDFTGGDYSVMNTETLVGSNSTGATISTASSTANGIQMSRTGTTTPAYFVADLQDYFGVGKSLVWTGVVGNQVAKVAATELGTGMWFNSNQITNFELTPTISPGIVTMMGTTTLTVYGSNN